MTASDYRENAVAPRRSQLRPLAASLWAMAGFLSCAVLLLAVNWPFHQLVEKSAQPDAVSYVGSSNEGRHAVNVRRVQTAWSTFGFGSDRCEALLGRSSDSGYGYYVELPVSACDEGVAIRWGEGGVRLKPTTGYEVFVPKDAFLGGR